MKSGCLGADRNYTKPISHSGDLNYQTEQSSGSCQQAQIPSLKRFAPCIISRERLRLYTRLGRLRQDQKQGKYNHFMEREHVLIFKVFSSTLLPIVTFLFCRMTFTGHRKIAYFRIGLIDSLPRAKRYTALDCPNPQH